MKRLKVLVLGFDGASPKLIDKWIDDLPTFKLLKEQGFLGQIIPPIPAQTSVAWTSFMTGKNPGKHGIFSFVKRKRGTYERNIVRPEMVRSTSLWRIISENEKRVGVINVPMSDVETVRGFLIPGFLSRSEGVPHPESLREKVKQKFDVNRLAGDVQTEILRKVDTHPDLFFERVNQITDEMAEISLYLSREEKWDFFITVFMGADRIQHFFWKYIDETHPKYEESKYYEYVRDYYVKIDDIVNGFLKSMEENTLIIVVSDHGFCPVKKEVVVNNYLEELGHIKLKNGKIDLERSEAVSYGYGDVWLNVKRREPSGLIEPGEELETIRNGIVSELKKIKIDDEMPIKDIKRREELFWGDSLSEAPDLITIFNVGWQAARRPEIMKRSESRRYVNENPRWSGGHDGTHDPTDVPGVLGFYGPDIQIKKEGIAYLWDVAPTILNLMDIPLPNDMDGKPLSITTKKLDV